jgi:hypothetical protein
MLDGTVTRESEREQSKASGTTLYPNVFVQLQFFFRLEKRRETTPDVSVVPGSSKTFLQQ